MESLTRRQLAGLFGSSALLAGCGAIRTLTSEPPQLYTLTPKSTFDAGLPSVDWQLLIEPPVAAAALDTQRIALRRTPTTIDYYADVQWTARAPEMVQTLIVESFENSRQITSIGRESVGLRADYVLKSELREFQVETYEAGPPNVRVRLSPKLVRIPERVIIAGDNLEFIVAAVGAPFAGIVSAFDEALGKVLKRLVEWTLTEGQADWPAQRRASGTERR